MEQAQFGTTGHLSSRAIFGAAALSSVMQAQADRAIETAVSYGVNHFDTAASFGESERLLGPWLQRNRTEVFLATKTGEHRRDAAHDELHRSLERLHTDHVDLWQLHNFQPQGLNRAAAVAKNATARTEGKLEATLCVTLFR